MLDIHTHILPGMDDGSSSIEESIRMLRELRDQGIDEVVFTSHFYAEEERPESYFARRDAAYNALKPYLDSEFSDMKFHLGVEVCYYIGISHIENIERFCISGTPLFLLELPLYSRFDEGIIGEVIDLSRSGKAQIILAHIDRYLPRNKTNVFEAFRRAGALMQLNCDFLSNKANNRKIEKLLRLDLLHFMGTDCHNMEERKPNYADAVDNIEDNIGLHVYRPIDYYEKKFFS